MRPEQPNRDAEKSQALLMALQAASTEIMTKTEVSPESSPLLVVTEKATPVRAETIVIPKPEPTTKARLKSAKSMVSSPVELSVQDPEITQETTPPIMQLAEHSKSVPAELTALEAPQSPQTVEPLSTEPATQENFVPLELPETAASNPETAVVAEDTSNRLLQDLAEILFEPATEHYSQRPTEAEQGTEQLAPSMQTILAEHLPLLEPEQAEQASAVMTELAAIISALKEVPISEITIELISDAEAQIEQLCAELYEICGLELSQDEIKDIVHNILQLACAPTAELSLSLPQEHIGTHEVKSSLSKFIGRATSAEQSLLSGIGKIVLRSLAPSNQTQQPA